MNSRDSRIRPVEQLLSIKHTDPQRYPEAPTAEEVNTVLAHMAEHDTETYLVYRLDATIGVRRNELPAMRFGDVDLDNQCQH